MKVRDLHYAYPNGQRALRGITMDLPRGSFTGIMGSNGSGKTTLALCLKGLLQPSQGEIEYDGGPPEAGRPHPAVGIVFQNPDNQLVATSVEREIAFGLENQQVPREEMRTRVAAALEMFGLESLRDRPPHLLSGGERQKVACAAVFVMEPQTLILDEATSLLDPMGRRQVMALVRNAFERRSPSGFRLVVITQYPEEIADADHLWVLHQGRVACDGSPSAVFSRRDLLCGLGLGVPIAYACA